ncbi:hypothetical protein ANCCEY_07250 [Ancylostoma ceylanicum]|uniref:Uncharacterized protein n=1 Tax=Ancylostoma ceylanicum TaxID=53326 RepID=A0A0D6LP63_9BILA|nr:hypothetical protein ANCCEY_07250 [Ancylostoma ceylanicum]
MAVGYFDLNEIVPQNGELLIFDSSIIPEEYMNRICANALSMKACIVIRDSGYKSLRCPYLHHIESCSPDRPFLEIVNNPNFHDLYLPDRLRYPNEGTPVVVELNPLIPTLALSPISNACPGCRVTNDIACGLMERDYTQIELVTACAGKEIIRPPRGYEIVLDSATVSEDQLNALCSNAVYLEACITISESQFKSLRCPRLEFLVSCRPERPAITIVNNPAFERLQIPEQVRFHPGGIPLRLEKNPMIEKDDMEVLKSLCPNCIIIPSNANTMDHNYQQWFGNVRIEPQEGSMLVFDSSAISERDMNKIFENVVYMKACLIISNSDYTNFRAPNLRHIESCAPDRPAVMLFNNPNLRNFFIPPDAIFVQSENAQLVVEINPLLPSYTLSALGELCPGCDVGRDIGCGSWNRPVTGAELVRACAGAAVIKPAPGIILQVNSSEVSEPELNELCSNVVYMKICITIYKSQFRSLRCPRLQMLESCEQGRPAIDLIDNPYLIDFYIPPNVVMDVGAIRIEINPQLPTRTLQGLEQAYPELTLTSDIVCGIGTRPYTLQEFIAACAGKPIIRPPPGGIIDLDATFMSEYDLNAICSEAVYMEVCITIARSNFQHLHCPKLQVLRSCSPDRPAIMVVDNPLFVSIIIPPVVVLSPYGIPIYFRNNPRLQKDPLKALEERYPNCIVIVEEEYVHVPDLQLWIGSPVLPPQSGNQTSPNSRNTTPTPENPWQPGAPGIPERPWTPGPSAIPGDLFRPGPGPIPGAPWRPAPGPIPEDPRVPAPNSIPGGPWRPGPGPIPGAPWKPDPNEVVGDRERPGPNPNPGDSLRPGPGPIPGAPWRPAPGPIPEDPQVPRPDPTREGIWRPGSTANPGAPWKPGPGPIPNDPRVPGPNPNPGDSLRPGPNPNPGGSWSTGPGPNPAAPWKPGPNGNVADKEKPSPGPNPGDSWRPGPGSIPNDPRVPGPNPNPGGPWRPGPGPIPTDPRVPGPNPNPGGSWSPGPGPNPGAPRKPGPDENVADKEKPSPGPNPGDSLRPGPGPIPNDPRVPGSNPSPGGPWRPGPDPSPGNQWGQTGPVGKPLVLDAYEIDEFVMNGLLAEVVYLKACIIVVNSNYTKLRIPRLRQLEPCEQNRPAIILFNNPFLVEFYMPEEVLYPADGVPMIVQLNPRLPPESLGQQQQHCPKCRVTDDVGCGLGFKEYTQKELIDACAGKAVIKPAPGFIIDVYSDYLTQSQINALCKDAIYMEICITIRKSSIKSLRCPKLRVLKPCQPGRAAIEIVENDFFEDLLIPSTVQYDPSDTPLHIELNPALPATILFSLQLLCPHCRLTNDIACGLSRKRYSAKELVRACAGTQIIRPVPGYMMVIDSREITEAEINALCSEAVYMEICLVISQSNIKSLKCPKLRTLKPCRPDEPAIKIVDNPVFETLELSEFLIYPTTGTPVQIENNPKLPEKMLRPIQDRCRNCITGTTEDRPALKVFKNLFLVDVYIPPTCSYPSTGVPIIMEINPLLPPDVMKAYQTRCPQCEVTPDIACGVDSAEMSVADIIINCANKAIIRPAPGSRIELDASQLTQKQLDDLCAKAIYMEICLNITKTQLKSLRCPMLQMLVPCETGRPAITIVNNPQFDNLYIPADCIFPPTGVTMYVELNPMIPTPVLQQLQQACPQCQLLEDIGCGLGRGHRSVNEILQACVGKKIIRPATGFVIEIDSLVATEDQINKICAAATYMEICIKMTRSNIQALRCPNLQVLKSCKPGECKIFLNEKKKSDGDKLQTSDGSRIHASDALKGLAADQSTLVLMENNSSQITAVGKGMAACEEWGGTTH